MSDTMIVATLMLISALIVGPIIRILIRDGGGELGAILKKCLGGVSFLLGLAIISWVIFITISPGPDPDPADNPFSIGQLVFAFGFLFVGWKWLFGSGRGIKDEDIDFDAPELVAAVEEARQTLPYFIGEVSRHVDGAYIKFPLEGELENVDHIWAYVHHYEGGVFNVSLANDPVFQEGEQANRLNVSESAVEDWQIMQPDGTIRGMFSLIGAFDYLENKGKRLTKTMRAQKASLVDAQT